MDSVSQSGGFSSQVVFGLKGSNAGGMVGARRSIKLKKSMTRARRMTLREDRSWQMKAGLELTSLRATV